jgi:hypothetical protein
VELSESGLFTQFACAKAPFTAKETMLSSRLVQLIEDNWEEIAKRTIAEVRKTPDLHNLASKTDAEMREWACAILKDLDCLLSVSKEQEVKRRFEVLGRIRFEEKIPLHETVLRFHILKNKIVGFVHEQGFHSSCKDIEEVAPSGAQLV